MPSPKVVMAFREGACSFPIPRARRAAVRLALCGQGDRHARLTQFDHLFLLLLRLVCRQPDVWHPAQRWRSVQAHSVVRCERQSTSARQHLTLIPDREQILSAHVLRPCAAVSDHFCSDVFEAESPQSPNMSRPIPAFDKWESTAKKGCRVPGFDFPAANMHTSPGKVKKARVLGRARGPEDAAVHGYAKCRRTGLFA